MKSTKPDLKKLTDLAEDLLHPEMFGHAANSEIRDRARIALGLEATEDRRPGLAALANEIQLKNKGWSRQQCLFHAKSIWTNKGHV